MLHETIQQSFFLLTLICLRLPKMSQGKKYHSVRVSPEVYDSYKS